MVSMAACKVRPEIEVNTFDCAYCFLPGQRNMERNQNLFNHFGQRATTETRVKLGGYDDPVLALCRPWF